VKILLSLFIASSPSKFDLFTKSFADFRDKFKSMNSPLPTIQQQQKQQGPKHQDNCVSMSGQETHGALKENLGNCNIQH
jgi:hypothetical protein